MIQKMDKDLYKYVGQQIREAREKKGISLRELSNMIGGKRSNQTLMRYEKGESRIDMESLVPICKALGLDVDAVTDEAKRRMYADTEELSDIQKAYAKADPQIQKAIRLMLHIDKQQKKRQRARQIRTALSNKGETHALPSPECDRESAPECHPGHNTSKEVCCLFRPLAADNMTHSF